MTRRWRPYCLCLSVCTVVAFLQAVGLPVSGQQIAPGSGWKFDVLHLKNGCTIQGYIQEEGPDKIGFWHILQKPGKATVRFFSTFAQSEIESIDRVDHADRGTLAARVNCLAPTFEQEQMEQLQLKTVPWGSNPQGGLSYSSDHFTLHSDAGEEFVRRAAYRLEQIYAAFPRLLPARCKASHPTRINLFQSLAEYHRQLATAGRNLTNAAYYDEARNEIDCASDLERLRDQLERRRTEHRNLQARLTAQEVAWNKQYHNHVPLQLMHELERDRQRLRKASEDNERTFEKATRKLFQTLYHEAFHAYLASCVYRPKEFEVPRWLNEGLAQILENAILEAGELRIGHVDPERLKRIKSASLQDELIPLDQLVRTEPERFLVQHGQDERLSDRLYLTSWAFTFYMVFERKKLDAQEVERYLRSLKKEDPVTALEQWAGLPLDELEAAFKAYVKDLRADGRTARRNP
jgi:hypothetical protein